MDWIEISLLMIGAVSVTLGLVHLSIWLMQRKMPVHLWFAVAALSGAALAVLELGAMQAQTPEQYGVALRWAHVPVAAVVVSLVGVVLLEFRASRLWLGLTVCALRLACLPANFLTGDNLNFQEVTALSKIEVWGGGVVSSPQGTANPWMALGQLSNLLMLVFLADAVVSVWREKNQAMRRRALLVCGSIGLFMLCATLWTLLVVMGLIHGPLTINSSFLAVLLVMGYQLGREIFSAGQLKVDLFNKDIDLRDSEQRVALAASAAGLGLWTWDIGRDLYWFNAQSRAILGLQPEEIFSQRTLLASIHVDDRRTVALARQQALDTGAYHFECRLPMLEDGGMRWVSAKGGIDHAPAGRPRFMRGVLIDITDQREAEERFRLLVEHSPSAMFVIDNQGSISLANRRAAVLFGCDSKALLGVSINELLPGFGHWRSPAGSHVQAADLSMPESSTLAQMVGFRRDGTEVPVEVALNPIRIQNQPFVGVTLTDLSERLRVENEAALQRQELAHLSRVTLLGEMSGSLAHELNQPLTAILSNAQAGLRFLDHVPPALGDVRDCLAHVVENDKRAGEVIRRLRALLRKDHVNFQTLDLNEMVHDVMKIVASDLINRNVKPRLELAPSLPLIQGDRVQLQQVLLNLVMNGCDAMDALDVMSSQRVIKLCTRCVGQQEIEVMVSDNGSGIPEEDLERIFVPFMTTKPHGLGFGLAICRTIINEHQGKLWASKRPQHGSTLHFLLPASQKA